MLISNFLLAFKATFGDSVFNGAFGVYTDMHPGVVQSIFFNAGFLRAVTCAAVETEDPIPTPIETAISMIEAI